MRWRRHVSCDARIVNWWSDADYTAFRDEVLGDFEDDALGVYEVWWTANTRFPDKALSERLALAEAVTAELVRHGTAVLFRGKWVGREEDSRPVAAEDVPTILQAWASWVPQENDVVWMDKTAR